MLWAGIIGIAFVVSVRMPEMVKLTAAIYYNHLNEDFDPWVEDIALVIIDDKSPSRSTMANQTFLRHKR